MISTVTSYRSNANRRCVHFAIVGLVATLMISISTALPTPALAATSVTVVQFQDPGTPSGPYGPQEGDFFGAADQISANGLVAVVGAPQSSVFGGNAGAAYVYTNSGGSWSLATTLQPTVLATSEFFGTSVAITPDGSEIVVGVGGESPGDVYVFDEPSAGWSSISDTPQSAELTGSDTNANDYFGTAIAVSNDGTTVIVGARYKEVAGLNYSGEAYVFSEPSSGWSNESVQTQSEILMPPTSYANTWFGWSVALSGDGSMAFVGSFNEGTVSIYDEPSGGWNTGDGQIVFPTSQTETGGGSSIAASYSGTTFVAGFQAAGEVSVFNLSGSGPTLVATLLAPNPGEYDANGFSVAISQDGSEIVSGDPNYTVAGLKNAGSAFEWGLSSNSTWSFQNQVGPNNPETNGFFGGNVGFFDDSDFFVSGGSGDQYFNNSPPATVAINGPVAVNPGAIYSATTTTVGFSSAVTFSLASGSPAWLAVDPSSGAVSGALPPGISSFTYSVTASNSTTSVTSAASTVYVYSAPTLVTIGTQGTVNVGSYYDAGIEAPGAYPSPTYALAPGAPAWLTIDPVSGTVSGTVPFEVTSFSFSVIATNSLGSTTSAVTTVSTQSAPPFSVSVISPPGAPPGAVYLAQATATGAIPAATFALSSSAPSWLSIDAVSGAITGAVPSGINSFSYTVIASNAFGSTSTTVNLSPPTSVTVSGNASTRVNTPYFAQATAVGANPTATYALSPDAPAWLSINSSTGVVSGSSAAGISSFSYSVIASNQFGQAVSAPLVVAVDSPASSVIVNGPSTVFVGSSYSATTTALGAVPAVEFFIITGNLPWLSINSSTGFVSGTVPVGITSFTYSVYAVNTVAGVGSAPVVVTVESPPSSVTIAGPSSVGIGSRYSATATALGGNPAAAFALSPGAPSWLAVDPVTGVVSGMPSGTSFSYSVIASNSFGSVTSAATTVTVIYPPTSVSVVGPSSAAIGSSYSATATEVGAYPSATFGLAGAPSWLSINATTGVVSGTVPGGITSFNYVVIVANSVGIVSDHVVVVVDTPATSVSISGPKSAPVGSSYSALATALGGYPASTFALAGAPSWLSINVTTGVVSGTVPSGFSSFNYSVSASNLAGTTTSTATTVIVTSPPTSVVVMGPASIAAGAAYVSSATALGASPATAGFPVSFALSSGAPSWLSINVATGAVSGTVPVGISSFNYSVIASNPFGSVASATTTVAVTSPPTSVSIVGPSSEIVGSNYSATATALGANPASTFALSSGAPSWLSINVATGAVSGTVPAGTTSFSYSVIASNSFGSVTSAVATVNVLPGSTSLAISSLPNSSVTVATAVTYTATAAVTSGSGALTGKVSFTDNGKAIPGCTNLTLSGSKAACSLSFSQPGNSTISATYGSDLNFGPSTSSITQVVLNTPVKPVFTSVATATVLVGQTLNFTVTTTGYPYPTLAVSGTLPKGMLTTSGANGSTTITFTPATGSGGSYDLTLTATNSAGKTTQTFVLIIDQAPTITSAATATATIGHNFSFTVTTSGYPGATVNETGNLPKGVRFVVNSNGTAAISGVPAAGTSGTFKFAITATNTSGTATQNFVLTVKT